MPIAVNKNTVKPQMKRKKKAQGAPYKEWCT